MDDTVSIILAGGHIVFPVDRCQNLMIMGGYGKLRMQERDVDKSVQPLGGEYQDSALILVVASHT